MEVVGKIKVIESVIEKGTFKSRNVIVTTDEQYPQHISVQFVQDKCDILNSYKEGQNVKVSINLRGREWVNAQGVSVYFNTIQGWRIEKVEGVETADLPSEDKVFEGATVGKGTEEESDLPF
jgi:translation initiation factor IF-3